MHQSSSKSRLESSQSNGKRVIAKQDMPPLSPDFNTKDIKFSSTCPTNLSIGPNVFCFPPRYSDDFDTPGGPLSTRTCTTVAHPLRAPSEQFNSREKKRQRKRTEWTFFMEENSLIQYPTYRSLSSARTTSVRHMLRFSSITVVVFRSVAAKIPKDQTCEKRQSRD